MDDRDRLLDEAEQALDEGRTEDALALARRAEALDHESAEAVFLQAEALLDAGDFTAAEALYRRTDQMAPDEPAILTGRGICLFEQARFESAESVLRLALELDSRMPEAHHHLGLLLERRGSSAEAKKHFARARRLAPETFRAPIEMEEQEFEACIAAALSDLPARVDQALDNISVSVEDLPATDDLRAADPPLSPQILGMWRGTPLTEKTVFDPWSEMPGGIVLYQKNLQRFARDRDDLIEQIRITVLHEVGHALGLDEDELDDRGLA